MNDSDVLQRAAGLLRSEHDGQREGSGFTRARILGTLAERRRPRRWRWVVLAPLGTLLVGSAWAQSTGNWSHVWQAVAAVLSFEKPGPPRGAVSPPAARRPPPAAPPKAVPLEAPAAPDLVLPDAASTASLPAAPTSTPAPARHVKAAPKVARTSAEPAAEPARDPELSQFRAAHELQLQAQGQRQRQAAIDAYAEYLRAYPHGRFVPEARYNTALDWIKLGDVAAARGALAPFADGKYDGYRQQEARELLDALGPSNESKARR